MEFLFSKLHAYKVQPSGLHLFGIGEIHVIMSAVSFLCIEVSTNK